MTRLKVKVKATPKLRNRPFSKSISAVCDPIFEIPSDSDNMEQYLNLVRPVFLKFVLVIESRVFKVGKIVDVIRSKKNLPDLDETWYVGRGR